MTMLLLDDDDDDEDAQKDDKQESKVIDDYKDDANISWKKIIVNYNQLSTNNCTSLHHLVVFGLHLKVRP